MTSSPFVLLDDSLTSRERSLLFESAEEIVCVDRPEDVEAGLRRVSDGLARGLHVAGYFSYELGYCLEPKVRALLPARRAVPLFWVGLYSQARRMDDQHVRQWLDERGGAGQAKVSDLALSWSRENYGCAFRAVQDYIAAGDVYQINLTQKYLFDFEGDPVALYASLRRRQRVAYGALIETPDLAVLSLSPELFFRREEQQLTTRPMKGTAPRGRTPREDARLKTWLAMDEKQRAENLMIVDLLRNDLARVSRIGSVEVTDLFTVETYRTVHQMTSGITSELRSDMEIADMLRALFPCGSITGAPKVRSMEIIRELEKEPRGIYTGAIGTIAPSGECQFNVAIRTAVLSGGRGEMGIGGGIVADSKEDSEYAECLLKAQFLTESGGAFELIETLRWQSEHGYHLLERHLSRLQASAAHFGYPYSREAVLAALDAEAAGIQSPVAMVRLLLFEDGTVTTSSREIELPTKDTVWRFVISDLRLDEKDLFFYHKTTRRQFYDREMERQKDLTGCDEVVFFNMRGELTEGTRTTLFVERDGRLFTPALRCGLLPGTLREELLDLPRASASEAVLTEADLRDADRIYLGNSVRGLVQAKLLEAAGTPKPSRADQAH
ncbi:MAG: aminodeoxychorismate synthase component I [Methyloceanibacter sp.]|uniref:aminodeoxychorismate synthase component I n=1 Tax=Methyloceanibacter sp. TaxID=1965321 RepID=UPI003C4D5653